MKKLFGFTLSEILIALAIVGAVAALTIPQFAGNAAKKQYITAFKATMNSLQSGIQTFKADNGYDFSGNRLQTQGPHVMRQMLEQKLGAQLVKLRTSQQWVVQGIIAKEFDVIAEHATHIPSGGDSSTKIYVYADHYFTSDTLVNAKISPIDQIQTLAFGTDITNRDYDPPASATNNPTGSATYKLKNGAYMLILPNDGYGCNFNNVRWDPTNNKYISPDIFVFPPSPTGTNLCLAYIDVNGPKGPNRITNCITKSSINSPQSTEPCSGMMTKEVADVFPILFFDDQIIPANAAAYTVLNDAVTD